MWLKLKPEESQADLRRLNDSLKQQLAEQKCKLEHVRESEQRYRGLYELAPDAIVTLDWRGRITSSNGAKCGIDGYSVEDVLGKPFWKIGIFRLKDIPKYLRLFISVIRGNAMQPIELLCVSKDGTEVNVECRASIMHARGKAVGLQIIARDVSELRKAEGALRESEQTLLATLESTADGILVIGADCRIRHFNQRFLQIWGFPPQLVARNDNQELLKFAAAQLRDPQMLLSRVQKTNFQTGTKPDELRFKDGRIVERFAIPLLRDGQEAGRVCTFRDVTIQHRSQRLAAIGEMAAGLAHENRNAMQRIQACLEMLALEVQDRPEALDLLQRMQAAQDRLHHLHEQVREYAAPIVLDCRPLKIDHVAREAWRHLEAIWSLRRVRFRSTPQSSVVSLDRLAIESVFRNIFENSLAACGDPAEIEVCCTAAALNGRPATEIVVRDNGPGLNPEQQSRIFEPFYTTKTQGTGLGMAISRRLIEAHSGRIAARAAARGGTEIVITLPGSD